MCNQSGTVPGNAVIGECQKVINQPLTTELQAHAGIKIALDQPFFQRGNSVSWLNLDLKPISNMRRMRNQSLRNICKQLSACKNLHTVSDYASDEQTHLPRLMIVTALRSVQKKSTRRPPGTRGPICGTCRRSVDDYGPTVQ